MAPETWPSSLPDQPIVDGYTETPPTTQLRTEMDAGPDKVRQRFTANVRKYQVQMILDDTQVSTFDTFYTDDTNGGSVKFDFEDPRTGNTKEFRFQVPPEPQYQAEGGNIYRVTFALEELPS